MNFPIDSPEDVVFFTIDGAVGFLAIGAAIHYGGSAIKSGYQLIFDNPEGKDFGTIYRANLNRTLPVREPEPPKEDI